MVGGGPGGGERDGVPAEGPHGLQRPIRRTANQEPRSAPWPSSASIAYCEHVGWKRHGDGRPALSTCHALQAAVSARAPRPITLHQPGRAVPPTGHRATAARRARSPGPTTARRTLRSRAVGPAPDEVGPGGEVAATMRRSPGADDGPCCASLRADDLADRVADLRRRARSGAGDQVTDTGPDRDRRPRRRRSTKADCSRMRQVRHGRRIRPTGGTALAAPSP
jgi:hypothetical protein